MAPPLFFSATMNVFRKQTMTSLQKRLSGNLSRPLLAAAFILFLGAGCSGKTSSNAIAIPDAGPAAVAVVNGVPITEADVEIAMRRVQHSDSKSPETRKAVIENIVREELVRQAAVKNGYDNLPERREHSLKIFAAFMAAQRADMADAFFSKQLAVKAKVSDEVIRKYFEAHGEELRAEFHLYQIMLKKDEAAIQAMKQELDSGTPFEEVAAKRFPDLPKSANRPWDLGYLRWSQLPAEWRGVVGKLQPGEVSDIIRGAGQRFWIVKLIAKRTNDKITPEGEKAIIEEILQREKLEELRTRSMDELRKSATITYRGAP